MNEPDNKLIHTFGALAELGHDRPLRARAVELGSELLHGFDRSFCLGTRRLSDRRARDQPHRRRIAERFQHVPADDDRNRRAVVHADRVAGGNGPFGLEIGGEPFERGRLAMMGHRLVAGILGPLAFGSAVALTGSSRPAVLMLVVFFVLGALVLTRVDLAEGERQVADALI